MGDESAVAFRILGPRDLVTGVTDTQDALENVQVDQLPDGALCWVTGSAAQFRWVRASTAVANGTTIILPAGQDSSESGRWLLEVAGGGGAATPGALISVAAVATVTVAAAPTATAILGAFALDGDSTFFTNTNGLLTYTGPSGLRFRCEAKVTADLASGAGTLAILGAILNSSGTLLAGAGAGELDPSGVDESISGQALVTLVTGDTLSMGMSTGPGPRDLDLSLLSFAVNVG